MKNNLWKKDEPGSFMTAVGKSLSVKASFVAVLVATLSIGCSNNPSKSTPQKPTPSPSMAGEGNAQPTKVTSRASSSKKDRDNENEDEDSSNDSPRPARDGRDSSRDTASDTKTTLSKNPPLDLALARMTCDAPPIRGDAIKLIDYLSNPNPPGGERLTPEERRSALDSVKGIDVTDPASVKIVQDQLDDACKK